VEGIKAAADPSQTYTLYLPSAYDPARKWPVMLVLDPRGRSVPAAELFREAAERYGWILVSSNDTRSDGGWEPNRKALSALWPEVTQRYASDPRRIYAAGFSGTVLVAWNLGFSTNGLAGVIAACGRHEARTLPVSWAQYSATGTEDFNYLPTLAMEEELDRAKAIHRLAVFDGPHAWMPKEMASEAVEWLEALAMKQGLRVKDPALAKELYTRDLARAKVELDAGDLRSALDAYRSIAATYAGLVDASEAARQAESLASSKAWQEAERDDKSARRFEEGQLMRAQQALGAWQMAEVAPPAPALVTSLGISGLRKQAAQNSAIGHAAGRVLAAIHVQVGFYMPRELQDKKRFKEAATLYEVAAAIRPEDPVALYNLACAQALAGDRKRALATLDRSVKAGWEDAAQMEKDPDLASLRQEKAFTELLDRIRQKQKLSAAGSVQ
jgi:tetratricopeptide (TPR) repeat protein